LSIVGSSQRALAIVRRICTVYAGRAAFSAPARTRGWRFHPQGVPAMTDHSLDGKVVLIAGGAKNLGGLIARDLARHGAKAVAIHYNSDGAKADAEATVAEIEQAGARAAAFQADLTSAGAMEKLFADA